MKIKEIDISGIGCIHNLHLEFNDKMNIICGPNGIGKTTIIESVASMFMYGQPTIKRNVADAKGTLHACVDIDGVINEKTIEVRSYIPNESENTSSFSDLASKIISIKVSRNFGYSKLEAIPSDRERNKPELWKEVRDGIKFDEVKGWFVNRYLYSAREGTLSQQQISNYHLAEKCFSIINDKYSFSRVQGDTNDIMVNTPQGEIYFEYLSSGFKSTIYLLFSTIKEIEFRFKEQNVLAEDFDGIILIDEVEIHLHPEWQEKIISILKETFPCAQFIVTTHSPHVIQTAEPNQVIALQLQDDNDISIRTDLKTSKYGFKGWTIEEILYDVMGMHTMRSEIYHSLINDFGKAIDEENETTAKEIYNELDQLLHPKSSQRKLLNFQLAKISQA